MDLRNRRRLQALFIALIFMAPIIIIGILMLSGWAPNASSYGQQIKPERDLSSMPVTLADGKPFHLADHRGAWTLVALPGPDCATRCLQALDLAHRAQITLNQKADKMRLLYLGAPPTVAKAAGFEQVWHLATSSTHPLQDLRATQPDSVSIVLVKWNGEALTHYPAGFSAEGLRQDIHKVVQ